MPQESVFTKQVALYQECEESWKREHIEAQACFSLEEVVALGSATYDVILAADESWRRAVYRGELQFQSETQAAIQAAIEHWLAISLRVSKHLAALQQTGFSVAGADEMRSRVREALAMLTPDSEFFGSDALVELRDAALDMHARGETVE